VSGRVQTSSETLSATLQDYLRASGYSQKELAEAVGLHPKVLSRKLHGSANAHLTHLELKRIIITLADWHAIGTQDEVLRLSEMLQGRSNLFSEEEWQNVPLSGLTRKHISTQPTDSSSLVTSSRQHNLPAPATKLIGRDWAVRRLQELLEREDVRLVTLVGSGGSGKTRLALHIASIMAATFTHGVRFVSLARVHDPKQVPMSIIQALQITAELKLTPMESVISYLSNKQLLLVLDNFEQMGEATEVVDELLTALPELKILTTSRALLHVYGEHAFSVPPLDLPDPNNASDKATLAHYGAIQLFVERAQAMVQDFALTDENAATIAQICTRVDGLPLALELAAARVKMLTPTQLLERLTKARLSVLVGGAKNLPARQQTLRKTIEWSYNLLNPVEQVWFRRLGVFTSSWSLEAAEAMMQDRSIAPNDAHTVASPLDMLERLVDNSLVVRLPRAGTQARFAMLETLREYAIEGLAMQEENERLQDWHACYCLREAETAERGLRGPRQTMWLARLAADHDNFRAALEWSLQKASRGETIQTFSFARQSIEEDRMVAGSNILSQHGWENSISAVELCLRLAPAFRSYLEWQGYLPEARGYLRNALALPVKISDGEAVAAARGKALSEAARLACLGHDQEKSAQFAEESIALWRQLNDAWGLASALLHRSWAALATSDYETAKRVCWEGMSYLDATEDRWLRAQLYVYLAATAGFTSDYEQMRIFYERSWKLSEQVGDKSAVADVLKDHGGMLILQSQYTDAINNLLRSIQLSYELGHKQYLISALGLLSFAVGLREEPDAVQACLLSAQLEGAGQALREAIGFTSWLPNYPLAGLLRQHIRSRVDEQRYNEMHALGRTLTIEQVIELVS
jgi:predicted ATPase/transcriptional regulator with XRE-family HTH domain